jgi:hypothetical protein
MNNKPKFKRVNYAERANEPFVIEAKNLLQVKNAKMIGSYARFGREKACDMDLTETLTISKDNIAEVLEKYFNDLKKKDLTILKISFDIFNEDIKKIMDDIGYIDGTLSVRDYNLTTTTSISDKSIIKLIETYNKSSLLKDYLKLYKFLSDKLHPVFTLDEAIKQTKLCIKQCNYTYMHIEVIYQNFRITNTVLFPNFKKIQHDKINKFDLADTITYNYEINYYKMIKHFFHWLIKSFFDKLFKEHNLVKNIVFLYNEISDFRESIGEINNNICKLENLLNNNSSNKELNKEYNDLNQKMQSECKEYFMNISSPFNKYLKTNFIMK